MNFAVNQPSFLRVTDVFTGRNVLVHTRVIATVHPLQYTATDGSRKHGSIINTTNGESIQVQATVEQIFALFNGNTENTE